MINIPNGFKFTGGNGNGIGKLPKTVTAAIEYLQKLPFKELVGMREVAEAAGVTWQTMSHYTTYPAFQDYKVRLHHTSCVFGSKKTIEELKRALKEK